MVNALKHALNNRYFVLSLIAVFLVFNICYLIFGFTLFSGDRFHIVLGLYLLTFIVMLGVDFSILNKEKNSLAESAFFGAAYGMLVGILITIIPFLFLGYGVLNLIINESSIRSENGFEAFSFWQNTLILLFVIFLAMFIFSIILGIISSIISVLACTALEMQKTEKKSKSKKSSGKDKRD